MNNIPALWAQENADKIELIDVRTPEEFAKAHAKGSINIPKEELIANPEKYLDNEKEYFLMCGSGGRSQFTITRLFPKGFKLTNVAGGIGAMDPKKLIIETPQDTSDSKRIILSLLKETKMNFVMFFAVGCGTCEMQKPILASLEERYNDVSLVLVNILEGGEMARQEQIVSAPTTIAFIEGKEVFRFNGFMPESDILEKLK